MENRQKKTISLEEATRIYNSNKGTYNFLIGTSLTIGTVAGIAAYKSHKIADALSVNEGLIDDNIEELVKANDRIYEEYKLGQRAEVRDNMLLAMTKNTESIALLIQKKDDVNDIGNVYFFGSLTLGICTVIIGTQMIKYTYERIKHFRHGPVHYIRKYLNHAYELRK